MQKALILQNKYIGDVLVASLLAKNLKRLLPGLEVHFFCYDKAKAVLEKNPYIDKIIYFDDQKLKKLPVLWRFTRQIRKEQYDYLIDPYSKLQSRFITLFSGAKTKISYDKPFFKYLYDYRIKEKKYPEYVCCTSIENRLRLLTPIESDMSSYDFQTEIFLSEDEKKAAADQMKSKGVDFRLPTFMIAVLGSSPTKSLPADTMAELINHLLEEYEGNFILNYIPNQQKQIDEIIKKVKHPEKLLIDILGKDVRELLSIMSHIQVLIGNEGGAINMAKALQKPSFSIYSPHKFRENWGCYENETIHQSAHLEEILPEYLFQFDLKATIRNPEEWYQKITPEYLKNKIDAYLPKIGINRIAPSNMKNPQPNHPKISALLITHNEEDKIKTYLEDVHFADEIIIVDSYSTDQTKNIATQNPKVVFMEREFDNFSNQKNFAIEQAQYPWIIFFDTDERISKSLKAEILQTIKNQESKEAYYIKRKFYFIDKPMRYSGWQNDKAIRLFKNGKGKYDQQKFVHESLKVDGQVGQLLESIDHYSLNNITTYQRKLNLYAKLRAKELFEGNKKANFFHYRIKPIVRFMHHFVFRFGFLDGKNGYIIAKLYQNYVAKRYYYLDKYWEEQQLRENQELTQND